MGLRLGMTEPLVALTLHRQGVRPGHIPREAQGCGGPVRCRVTLTAVVDDGDVMVGLGGDPATVDRIHYRVRVPTPGAPEIVAEAMARHFGPPDAVGPMTWCQHRAAGQHCADDQPRLRFLHETLTLVLSSGAGDAAGW